MSIYPTHDEDGVPYPDDDVDLTTARLIDAAGNVIDQAYVERSVADLRRVAGRPSLSGQLGRSPVLSVRLDPADDRALRRLAEERGEKVSTLVQYGVKALLEHPARLPKARRPLRP